MISKCVSGENFKIVDVLGTQYFQEFLLKELFDCEAPHACFEKEIRTGLVARTKTSKNAIGVGFRLAS